jgi:hypothetical protein
LDGRTSSPVAHDRPQTLRRHAPYTSDGGTEWLEVPGGRNFRIRAAVTRDERATASSLIRRRYAWRGYDAAALPELPCRERLTLVASAACSVVGTMTVGFDSELSLAVDEVFPEEVNSVRMAGRQVCEFTKLAVDEGVRSQRILAAMFHVAFIHAHRIRGCDNLLIEVNPRHVRYYERKLGFRVLSAPRLNKRIGAAAVLLSLDLWHAQEQIDKFGGKPELAANEKSLYPHSFSAAEEAGIVGCLCEQGAVATPSRARTMI